MTSEAMELLQASVMNGIIDIRLLHRKIGVGLEKANTDKKLYDYCKIRVFQKKFP